MNTNRPFFSASLYIGLVCSAFACGDDSPHKETNTSTSNHTTQHSPATSTSTTNTQTTPSTTSAPFDPCAQPTSKRDFVSPEYTFCFPSTRIQSARIETDHTVGADINADGQVNNALARLLTQLMPLLGETSASEEHTYNDLALGLTWVGFEDNTYTHTQNDLGFDFFLLKPGVNEHEWRADPASFIPDTEIPAYLYRGIDLTSGVLQAGPAFFMLAIEFAGLKHELPIETALITGTTYQDPYGIGITDGKVSGAVPLIAVADVLNNYLTSSNCSCLGLNHEHITGRDNVFQCGTAMDTSTCEASGQDMCASIIQFCDAGVEIMSEAADIDADASGQNDSLSFLVHFEGEPARIVGPQE